MLQFKAGVLLSLTWALSSACQPIAGQNLDVSKGRDVKVPGAGGEPFFSLHVLGEGRKGIVVVQDEKGAKLQTLVCPLLRDSAEATQSEIEAVREQFVAGFITTDLDFDGHVDLAGIREFGAKWARYCVWLYDPMQHLFMKDFLAEQMELLTNLEVVKDGQISSSGIGPANPWFALYRIAGAKGSRPERQLVPIYSCLVESMPDVDRPYAIVATRFENGKAFPERQEAASLDMKAALDKCNLDSQGITTHQHYGCTGQTTGKRFPSRLASQ